MTDKTLALAPAGIADLRLGASIAALAAGWGPRIAFAPDTGSVTGAPVDDAATFDDLADDELGLDDEPAAEGEAPVGDSPAPEEGAEPTEEEPAEEEEEGEPEEPKEPEAKSPDDSVKVKLDDGSEVTLSELKAGHLRQADYTRKTQEVARDRTQVAEAATRLVDFDKQTKGALAFASEVIKHYAPKAPDRALLQSDPATYLLQKEIYEDAQRNLQTLAAQVDRQSKGAASISEADHSALVDRELNELITKRPELRDAKKRDAFFADINTRAQAEYGFGADDLAGVTDHRAINVLADALAYRKLQANRPATMNKVATTAPMRPATRQPAGQRARAGQVAVLDRLRSSGSVEAAAAAFDDLDF